jgi:hypothetical protein
MSVGLGLAVAETMIQRAVLLGLLVLPIAACEGTTREVQVQSTATAPAARSARTYAIAAVEQAPPRYRTSPRSLEATQHIRPLLEEVLRAKGYVPAASIAEADLVWMFASGRREREKAISRPQHGGGESIDTEDPDEEYVEGALVIDALDKNGARVWHGFGRAEVDPDRVDDALLRKAVTQVMARFPNASP